MLTGRKKQSRQRGGSQDLTFALQAINTMDHEQDEDAKKRTLGVNEKNT